MLSIEKIRRQLLFGEDERTVSDTSVFYADISVLLKIKKEISKSIKASTDYQPILLIAKHGIRFCTDVLSEIENSDDEPKFLSIAANDLYKRRKKKIRDALVSSLPAQVEAPSDLKDARLLLAMNTALTKSAENILRFKPTRRQTEMLKRIIKRQRDERERLVYLIRCIEN